MAIQQVISDSPITGWIWIPGAGENGGTSDRRTQVALFADLEPAPASLTSTVPDIFPSHSATPVHRPARLAPDTCSAIVADGGKLLTPGGIRTNGAGRFERTFLTVCGSAPRL
jgi:hypothetical protein